MTDSEATGQLESSDAKETSWLWLGIFRNPQVAALFSACCFLIAHWSSITIISDRATIVFVLCISTAFIITTLYLANANIQTCSGCLVWLYVVVIFANVIGIHESLHIMMDLWAITSAAAIALASSSYSETYFQVWGHFNTPGYAMISIVWLCILTDACTYTMSPNRIARYILWALWFVYAGIVAGVTGANRFVQIGCLTWLWIVSIFILTTESPDFRVFLFCLWAVTSIAAFCFPIPPSFDPPEFIGIGIHKTANISCTCFLLWVHIYLSRMGCNAFVMVLLWLLWIMYTMSSLDTTIPGETLFYLGVVYGLMLFGWTMMNLIPKGKTSPLVPQVVADIWIGVFAVITCSCWAYFT